MNQDQTQNLEQRGKRRSAFRFEIVALVLVALAILDVGEASEVFTIAFTSCLAYAAALRGVDAHYAPK